MHLLEPSLPHPPPLPYLPPFPPPLPITFLIVHPPGGGVHPHGRSMIIQAPNKLGLKPSITFIATEMI